MRWILYLITMIMTVVAAKNTILCWFDRGRAQNIDHG